MDDGTSAELEDEEPPMNVKGNDWLSNIASSLVVGVIVGLIVSLMSRSGDKSSTNNDTLVEVRTKVEYLTTAVTKLTEQPYVRRDEFQSGVAAIENRLSGLDGRVNQLEQRDDRTGRQRGSP